MKFIFLLFLLPLRLFSQDLSGIWVGTIATSGTEMPLELVINPDLSGYSMMTFTYKGAENIAVKKMSLIEKDGFVTMSDDKIVYNNFTVRSRNVKTFCELSVSMVDSTMILSGPFHTRSRDLRAGDEDLNKGTITLRKEKNPVRTKLVGKLDSLKLLSTVAISIPGPTNNNNQIASGPVIKTADQNPATTDSTEKDLATVKVQQNVTNAASKKTTTGFAPGSIASATPLAIDKKLTLPAAEIDLRKTEIIRSIDFRSDSLTLTLYDNGIVDGDTVSVVLNGDVVIPKQGLSEKAYKKLIRITPDMGDSLQLVMYAENLGSIPPNTGLLIIEDGNDRQEIRFEGDMKKSSAVILRRKH